MQKKSKNHVFGWSACCYCLPLPRGAEAGLSKQERDIEGTRC
ncbi:MAG: hypothetical protein ACOX1I_01160 [Dethiobacteria bacterium]